MRCSIVVLAVAILAVVACTNAAERPKVPEMFSAGTDLEIYLAGEKITIHGKGVWTADQPEGRNNEFFNIVEDSHKHFNVRRLDRFDLKRSYEVIDGRLCHERAENGTMPLLWGWLSQAIGSTRNINGKLYDTWSFTMGYAKLTLAVTPQDANRPQILFVEAPERNTTVRFVSWNTAKPDESLFAIPKQCGKNALQSGSALKAAPSLLACVARSTMIARAQVWVNNRVPYNQQGHYQGYREDCSGYVSMAWETSQPGYTTFTMHEIAHPISKNDLQPGDCLLCASEHVVLFGGWTDAGKTHFTAFEETRPGEGTVKRVTPYPYWYNTGCFKPYRYNSAC